MKGLNKFAVVISKIIEVVHWIGTVCMIFLFGASAFAGTWLGKVLKTGVVFDDNVGLYVNAELKTYGLEIIGTNPDGSYNMTAIAIFSVGSALIMALMAMVFRNICLILKTAQGETKFSKGKTPFQEDIIRMIREIGIFLIVMFVVCTLTSIVAKIFIGSGEVVIDVLSVVFGVFMLCLSSCFEYGKKLEDDVDGLL